MTLLGHLVRYDLRSLRPLLAVWAAVLAIQAAVLRMGPPVPDGTAPPAMSLDVSAIVMRLAVTVVLAAALAQLHALVGTTAFWRTRPIPRGLVLVSAFATLLVLAVAVPAMCSAATVLWLGLDAGSAARVALAVAAEQLTVAAFALLLASVSKNLAQVVVAMVGAMGLFTVGRIALGAIPRRPLPFAVALDGGEWLEIWLLLLLSGAAAAIAAYQHLAMKTERSAAAACLLVALLVVGSRFPAWTIAAAPGAATPVAVETPDLAIDPASIRVEHFTRLSRDGAQVGVRCSGVLVDTAAPGAVIQVPTAVRAVLQYPDGKSERFAAAAPEVWADTTTLPVLASEPYASLAAALDGATLAEPVDPPPGHYRVTFLEARSDTYATRATEPARLDVRIELQAFRYTVAARLPLRADAAARARGYLLAFEGEAPLDDGVSVAVRETYLRDWRPIAPAFYVLRNQRLREAVVATLAREEGFRATLVGYPAMFVRRAAIDVRTVSRERLSSAWLADAELLVLKPDVLGRVTKTIRLDGFTLAPREAAPR